MTSAANMRQVPPRQASPTHHLSEELLLDYAAGTLSEPVGLMVATHLTLCPECRARAAMLDVAGGALLDACDAGPVEAAAFDALMARIDAEDRVCQPANPKKLVVPANDSPSLPRPLQSYIGGDVDSIAWKPIGLGVEIADLITDADGVRAFMLKVPGGRKVPRHTHIGNEYVMVLEGAYVDESGRFGRGDVEAADDSVEHQPIAEAGSDCICLAVTDAPLRITGPFGWIMNRLSRL